jgi:hypothetical protein
VDGGSSLYPQKRTLELAREMSAFFVGLDVKGQQWDAAPAEDKAALSIGGRPPQAHLISSQYG